MKSMYVSTDKIELVKSHLENLLPKPEITPNEGQNCTRYTFKNHDLVINVYGTGTISPQGKNTSGELAKSIENYINYINSLR